MKYENTIFSLKTLNLAWQGIIFKKIARAKPFNLFILYGAKHSPPASAPGSPFGVTHHHAHMGPKWSIFGTFEPDFPCLNMEGSKI